MNYVTGISGPYLEQAAVAELSDRLKQEGYEVALDCKIDGVRIDLVARRNGEIAFYEFKLAGRAESASWPDQLVRMQGLARRHGASMRLVFVRPPREMSIEIGGLEAALLAALRDNVPSEVADIAAYTLVEGVEDVDLTSIDVQGTRADVQGAASLLVTLQTGGGEVIGEEAFPFEFQASIDLETGTAEAVAAHSFDLTRWYGPPDDAS